METGKQLDFIGELRYNLLNNLSKYGRDISMATLADIAKQCEVSIATVSYVINGQGDAKRISPVMQRRILDTAEALGYNKRSVSFSYANAQRSKTPRLAVLWPQRNFEATMPAIIDGLNSAIMMDAVPASVSICPYESNHLEQMSLLWDPSSYDAAVIIAATVEDMRVLSQRHTSIPVVIHNRHPEDYSSVSIDHVEAGRIAAEHAICKVGNHVGIVVNPAGYIGLNARAKAFSDTCLTYGVDVSETTFYCENDIDRGYELGIKLARSRAIPKIIFCLYDYVAYGMARAFTEMGVNIGEEVQLIVSSTTSPQFFARSTPPMTVVDLRVEEAMQRAVRLALDLATRRLVTQKNILLPPQIIYRDSSPAPTTVEAAKFAALKRERYSNG